MHRTSCSRLPSPGSAVVGRCFSYHPSSLQPGQSALEAVASRVEVLTLEFPLVHALRGGRSNDGSIGQRAQEHGSDGNKPSPSVCGIQQSMYPGRRRRAPRKGESKHGWQQRLNREIYGEYLAHQCSKLSPIKILVGDETTNEGLVKL